MSKLQQLIDKCKCGVHVTVNLHRDYYETVQQHMEDSLTNAEELEDIPKEVYDKMKETNTIINIQFYPNSPVGSYSVFHYDLDKALDECLEIINE